MTTTRLDPIVVDLERDQDVVLRVDGHVVAVLVAGGYNAIHKTMPPEWCARPLRVDDGSPYGTIQRARISSGSSVLVSASRAGDLAEILKRMEQVR